jgi:hypothetical protein
MTLRIPMQVVAYRGGGSRGLCAHLHGINGHLSGAATGSHERGESLEVGEEVGRVPGYQAATASRGGPTVAPMRRS